MTLENTEQGNVVNMNGDKMNAGIAPTTPSSVDQNQITPNTTYTAPPNSGDVAAANAPTTGGNPNYVQPQKPQAQQPHPISRIFDGILRNLSGPITVTDPVTGERRDVPQTRGNMGKSILAAALSGLMAPTAYRETPYGPVVDTGNTLAGAGKAGQEFQEKRQAKAQQMTNDQQAAKLMTIQNNFNLVKMQAASAHMKHEMLDENLKNSAEFKSAFDDYDKLRTGDPSMPPAFAQQDMLANEVLNGGHQLSDASVMMTGKRMVWNASLGQMEPEPTYSIINPALKDIALPQNVTDKLSEMNSQWKDIHSVVGGTVRVPVNAYVHAMHDYQAVTQGEATINNLAGEVGGKKATSLASAVKNDKTLMPALYALTEAGASGATVSKAPQDLLRAILTAPNGEGLLKLIGMTPQQASDKANEIDDENLRKKKLAESGGVGDKAIMPDAAPLLAKSATELGLTKAQFDLAVGKIPPQGFTVGEYKAAADKVQAQANENKKQENEALKDGGNPTLNQAVANNIIEGDISKITNLPTRGQARLDVMNRVHDEAVRRGLDSTQFSPAALENKTKTYDDYHGNKKGSTGGNITSFNAFLGHTALAYDATGRLEKKTFGNTGIPMINVAMDKLGKEVGDDPDWKAFKTSLLPVQNEISNFLAGGYKAGEAELALMNQVLDPHETPARIKVALKTLAETADTRLRDMGETYRDTMGTTFPNLLHDDARNTLKRLGITSRSAPLSVNLPRGWKGDNAQPLPANLVTMYLQAAGGNQANAIALAKQNGWR